MVKVLFVCLGNICRSPMAQGIFEFKAREAGLADKIAADSAGTGAYHVGEPPDRRGQAEMRRHGIDISGQSGRAVRDQDFADFDYVLAMDASNMADLRARCPDKYAGCLHKFLDFAPELPTNDVPDPYYGGEKGFSNVYALLDAASDGLLARIRSDHGL